jgi:hypothetical protein
MKPFKISSIYGVFFDGMFVSDKHGKVIFFPWGSQKQGYLLKNKGLSTKIKEFYFLSLFVYFITLGITISMFYDFWSIVGLFVTCSVGWFIVYYFYIANITKSLSVAQASYKEIVLEKLEIDASEESKHFSQFPTRWNYSTSQPKKNGISPFKRFGARFSPMQLAVISFLVGLSAGAIELSYHPQKYSGSADSWLVFFPCFFFGLGGFIFTFFGEAPQEGVLGFILWKLPMLGVMIVFWLLAFWSLYDFVVVIVK